MINKTQEGCTTDNGAHSLQYLYNSKTIGATTFYDVTDLERFVPFFT